MGKVIVGISMSLDGFINDKNGSVDPLYPDFGPMHDTQMLKDAIRDTGAVVMGKHAYEMADPFTWVNGDYEFQNPIFVLTHTLPTKYPKGNDKLTITFITDGIDSAITHAKAAAGEKDVQIIGGASTFQQALNSGLCDEMNLDIISVLLGEGTKLFDHVDFANLTVERAHVDLATPQRTHMVFRLNKSRKVLLRKNNNLVT